MKQHLYRLNRELNHYRIHQSLCNWTPREGRVLFSKFGRYITVQCPDGFTPETIPDTFAEYLQTINVPMYNNEQVVELWSTINPTKKLSNTGKLVGLNREEVSGWVARKFEGVADVLDVIIEHSYKIQMYLQAYDVCILVKVNDKYKMRELMISGIGRGKFAGFGLLRVQK